MSKDLVTQPERTDKTATTSAAAERLHLEAYAHMSAPRDIAGPTVLPAELSFSNPYTSQPGTTKTDHKKESGGVNPDLSGKRPNPHPLPPQNEDGKPLWGSAIDSHGVSQGKNGDCFFESSLASLADTSGGDKALQNMIKQNNNGTYTVTFQGDKDNPVTVSQAEVNKLSNPSVWANVAEAAYLKYNHDSGSPIPGVGSLSMDGVSLTGKVKTQAQALHLLTGQDATLDTMSLGDVGNHSIIIGATSKDNIRRDLTQSFQRGEPVTASIGPISDGPLPTSHVYSVLGFDQKTNTVVVRNPWGHNDENFDTVGQVKDGMTYRGDGVVTMSFDTFTKSFDDVAFAGKNQNLSQVQQGGRDVLATGKDGLSTVSSLATFQPGDALDDAGRTVSDLKQLSADQLHGVSDLGSRAVGSVVSTGLDLAGKPFVTARDGASTITSLVTGHPGDAADHAVDTAGDALDGVTSTVTAPFHALGGLFH